jgi:putative restriction endonuclease
MKAYVGVTDWDWFQLLREQQGLDEVNFWQPSGGNLLANLEPGELFLFKLHSPRNFIAGGGVFAHASHLPISLAWSSFGVANGATSLPEMRSRVARYRRQTEDRHADYIIGCILLESPFFLSPDKWIPVPKDWKPQIVQGRYYDLTVEPGATLYAQLQQAVALQPPSAQPAERYGHPVEYLPRLGQGSFRVLVTDAYQRRCLVTGERTLPALEAAHIKPYSLGGEHRVNNGLLLRRDLHALFDQGYVTVTPQMNFEVSRRIREEFENGRDYYRLHGQHVREPVKPWMKPAGELLDWHNQQVFRG